MLMTVTNSEAVEIDHERARDEVATRLHRLVPANLRALLVEHLLELYGDESWPLLSAATDALIRRLRSVTAEELRIASSPKAPGVLGDYRIRARQQRPRPYRVELRSLQPLRVSCDCPDYLKSSLGLCKHGLAVLVKQSGAVRKWRRGLEEPACEVDVDWWPLRALTGPGDWLDGVRFRKTPVAGRHPAWLDAATKTEGRWRIFDRRSIRGQSRDQLVHKLEKYVERRKSERVDPALGAWLQIEADERSRRKSLELDGRKLRTLLSSLQVKLYPYQVESIQKFLDGGRLLLADDMGLGKTIQAAAIAHVLHGTGRARRILVIAPASLKSQWLMEWQRATAVPIEVVEGSPETRAETYATTTAGTLVANYEQCLRDLELIQAWQPDLVILDEAQRIKNWATRTALTVKRIDAQYRLVLTGTPLENRLDELTSIMDWIEPCALAPKWRLDPVHRYDDERGEGMQHLDVLRGRLAKHLLRRKRSEILADLPERVDALVRVEITPAQAQAHADLDLPIARLANIAQRRPLTQAEFLRLMMLLMTQRMIANGMGQLDFAEHWSSIEGRKVTPHRLDALHAPKLSHLRELISGLVVEQGRKVVIFSQWRRMLKLANWAVSDILQEAGKRAAFFTGGESQRARTRNVVEFHDDPSAAVLFCSDAGGVGLNLQRAASACIHLELPWNPAVMEQRTARIHRLGQTQPIDVYHLMTLDSIEVRIHRTLQDKKSLFDGVFDGCTDQVEFGAASGFLEVVRELSDDVAEAGDSEELEGPRSLTPEPEDTWVDAGDGDEIEVPAADERARPAPAGSREPGSSVQQLFQGVRVERNNDGSVRIDASAEAAVHLEAMFSGMAQLMAQARPG